MTANTWKSANFQMLSEPSDPSNAPLTVVPWSKFGTRRLYVDTADGRHVGWVDLKTGHRSLAMPELAPAFERAMSEAEGTQLADAPDSPTRLRAHEFALMAAHADEVDTNASHMRRAYRGADAYSTWDLGPRATRLVTEDAEELGSLTARMAYLNPSSVATSSAL